MYHKDKYFSSDFENFTERITNVMQINQLYDGKMPIIYIQDVSHLNVGKTFDCGQCFRFDRVESSAHEHEYSGVAFGKCVSFAGDGDTLRIYNSTLDDFERIWRPFLCLDIDYELINQNILERSQGTVMSAAMEYGKGIRILRQDAYEAVISFIISQNNNIPRIKKIVEALCEHAGEKIEIPDEMKNHLSGASSLCTFPSADALLSLGEAGLFELKTGFRAKYIYDAVERLTSGQLDLRELQNKNDTAYCIEKLCAVKGIGLKVASCASLFGMARYDAFPVDVWMKHVAQKYFSEDTDFNGSRFGAYAGIAQQYLFYYERYKGEEAT